MEASNEIKGLGNSYTAEFWEYDSRIGRRWNLDPVVKEWEGGYTAFHNSPVWNEDPLGLDPPKKPGFFTKLWRKVNYDTYKTRAEEYANKHGIDESNIIDAGNDTWVVVNDKKEKDIRFSVFRKSKIDARFGTMPWSEKNDDINLTAEQLNKVQVQGNLTIQLDLPTQAGSKAVVQGLIIAGGKSKSAIIGVLDKSAEALQAYKKNIRIGVVGHPDNLVKGFHLHFDEVVPGLELALLPMDGGRIGLIQVAKKVGTANDIKKAVSLFNQSMASSKFRGELLVKLKLAQEYMQKTPWGTKNAQQAINKAHELNYLIKAVQNY